MSPNGRSAGGASGAQEATLLVADSFRVDVRGGAACVRSWARHLERFRDSVRRSDAGQQGHCPEHTLRGFLAEAARTIRNHGACFPRLEAWSERNGSGIRFNLQLRPVPPLNDTIDLRTSPETVLETPGIKGPNIVRLSHLNTQLDAEALLVDRTGHVLEGATTSVLWWGSREGFVVAPPPSGERNRVPSITEAALSRIAADVNAPLTPALVTPHELSGYEVWAVNALHGIRVVQSIDAVTLRTPDTARLQAFQEALDQTWEPVVA